MNRNLSLAMTLFALFTVGLSNLAWAGKDKGSCMGSLVNSNVIQSEFLAVAAKFLTSVKQRDFQTFERFFREDLEFTAILPGGKIINDVPAFMASQTSWFNGKTGSFDFMLQRAEATSDLGTAFAVVDYKNVDSSGKPFELEIYISFIFRKVDGNWFLVHDQNTVLREVK